MEKIISLSVLLLLLDKLTVPRCVNSVLHLIFLPVWICHAWHSLYTDLLDLSRCPVFENHIYLDSFCLTIATSKLGMITSFLNRQCHKCRNIQTCFARKDTFHKCPRLFFSKRLIHKLSEDFSVSGSMTTI